MSFELGFQVSPKGQNVLKLSAAPFGVAVLRRDLWFGKRKGLVGHGQHRTRF